MPPNDQNSATVEARCPHCGEALDYPIKFCGCTCPCPSCKAEVLLSAPLPNQEPLPPANACLDDPGPEPKSQRPPKIPSALVQNLNVCLGLAFLPITVASSFLNLLLPSCLARVFGVRIVVRYLTFYRPLKGLVHWVWREVQIAKHVHPTLPDREVFQRVIDLRYQTLPLSPAKAARLADGETELITLRDLMLLMAAIEMDLILQDDVGGWRFGFGFKHKKASQREIDGAFDVPYWAASEFIEEEIQRLNAREQNE